MNQKKTIAPPMSARETTGLLTGKLDRKEMVVAKRKFDSILRTVQQLIDSSEKRYLKKNELEKELEFEKGGLLKSFFHPIFGALEPFNKTSLELIIKTRAMMLFPSSKYRAIRERLIRSKPLTLDFTIDDKTAKLVEKQLLRSNIVGVVFKIQCEHYYYAQRRRSLNVIMAANDKGFFCEWKKAGINVGLARKHMKEFTNVRHLLAADNALTWTDKKTNPIADKQGAFEVPFTSFYLSPVRFFLTADLYREWAKNAGLIGSKKELWMPDGWKSITQNVKQYEGIGEVDPGYADEIHKFDEFERKYIDNKEWQ
jgi:hypothetical protein